MLSCAALSPAVQRVTSHLLRASSVRLTAPKPWLAAAKMPLARQAVVFADERSKQDALVGLLASPPKGGTAIGFACLSLVACATRRQSEMVLFCLQGAGHAVSCLAHDRPKRAEKEQTLASFAAGATRVLVATDAALRAVGAELCPVGHVISFDFPQNMNDYAHRLSYTARYGHTGHVSTIVTDSTPRQQIEALVEVLQRTGSEVPRWLEGMAAGSSAMAVQ